MILLGALWGTQRAYRVGGNDVAATNRDHFLEPSAGIELCRCVGSAFEWGSHLRLCGVVLEDSASRVQLSGKGSSVEITSIPYHFIASDYNLLEQLFVPLLSLAQEANDVMGLRIGNGKSVLRASSYLAGELMRDESFSPGRSWLSQTAHAYVVDFSNNSFQVATVVHGASAEGSAIFAVKISGPIRGDNFVVVSGETKATLFSFTRFEAEKPGFFTQEFPFIAHEARKRLLVPGASDEVASGLIDLLIGIPVADATVTVRIRKQAGASRVEVKDPFNNVTFMSLPTSSLNSVSELVRSIGNYLSTHPGAVGPGSSSPRNG